MPGANGLRLEGIGKTYGRTAVLEDISLTVGPGQILGLTGPSGAGKTTICRLVSGIEKPETGSIWLAGDEITRRQPQERAVAYMFESYALYPQLNVAENVAFPLKSPTQRGRYGVDAIRRRVQEVLLLTEMGQLAERLPAELSGGQQQRVALCRALVQQPAAWLLDEPIAHLDAKLRNKLRGVIRRRLVAAETPTVWATPDAMEALSVADIVVVLIKGRIQQQATPEEIYQRPANTQVARLVGDPAMNLLTGRLRHDGDGLMFEHEAVRRRLPQDLGRRIERQSRGLGIVLGVRPNAIVVHDGDPPAQETTFAAQVYAWEPFGKYCIVSVKLGADLVKIKTAQTRRYAISATVPLSFVDSGLVAFEEATGKAI